MRWKCVIQSAFAHTRFTPFHSLLLQMPQRHGSTTSFDDRTWLHHVPHRCHPAGNGPQVWVESKKGRRAAQAHHQRNSVADSPNHVSIQGEKEAKKAAGLRRMFCDLCVCVSVEKMSLRDSPFSFANTHHCCGMCVSLLHLTLFSGPAWWWS